MVASGLTQRTEVSQYRLAAHLILALVIFAAVVWTVRRMNVRPAIATAPRLKLFSQILLGLTFLQIYFGALVAGLRAGRAYNTWPAIDGAFIPSTREYFHFYGLDREKLAYAKPGALVMHPGPMNRGVEIDSDVADDVQVSVIHEQVEMGVAIRMAVLDALARGLAKEGRNAP